MSAPNTSSSKRTKGKEVRGQDLDWSGTGGILTFGGQGFQEYFDTGTVQSNPVIQTSNCYTLTTANSMI